MALRHGLFISVCFLTAEWGAEGSAAGNAAGNAAGSAAGNAGAAIPEWRIDAALHPARALRTLLTDRETADSVAVSRLGQAMGSTLGQDQQRCPLVKLPEDVFLLPEQASWSGLSGVWESRSNGVRMAFWGQNYFSQGWETIYIRNQDERAALKVERRTLLELRQLYGWRPGRQVMSYSRVSKLERLAMAGAYHGYKIVSNQPNEVEVVAIKPPDRNEELERTFAFTDCEGQLLFVARMHNLENGEEHPWSMNIFDRSGGLVAHSLLEDPLIAKFQFIDTHGYLIATAEAPGLDQHLPAKDVPLDPLKGSILPFEIRFAAGGYPNASRLLDVDYRWVLAAAVQAGAVASAHAGWTPRLSSAVTVFYWCLSAVGFLFCLCTFGFVYHLVYPAVDFVGSARQPLWSPGKARYPAPPAYASFQRAL